jgi:hypothetical protein
LTLLSAVTAFGDSTPPLIITKDKSFQKNRLAEQELDKGHDYVIKSVLKKFMTEILFIDWSQRIFLPWNKNLIRRSQDPGSIVFVVDLHAPQVTAPMLTYAQSKKIVTVRFVAR